MWSLLTLYQALRIVMVDVAESVPGTDPDRCCFSIALHIARDQVIQAAGIVTADGDRDTLLGTIGRRILTDLLPSRRQRVSTRKVKSPMSRYSNPDQVDLPGAKPIALDITDPASVAATGGVTVLVNNAGSSTGADLLTADLDDIHLEMNTHYLDPLTVARAFAPQIAANGGGARPNVLSGLSWVSFPEFGAYCAAKSAERSLTNTPRVQLADQGIRVAGLHVGYMDTDMVRTVDADKSDPADNAARQAQAALSGGVSVLHPQLP